MDFYGDASAQNIDMRAHFDKLLYGDVDMVRQGRDVILRELSNDQCPVCFDKVSGGSIRQFCTYCDGEGFLWTERIVSMIPYRGIAPVYKPGVLGSGQYPQSDYGYTDTNKGTLYGRYDTFPNYERYTLPTHSKYDKIYEVKVDFDGNTVYPLVRTLKWKMLTVTPIHGDFGRVEMFELGCDKENIT